MEEYPLFELYKFIFLEFTMMLGGRRIEGRGFRIHFLSLRALSLSSMKLKNVCPEEEERKELCGLCPEEEEGSGMCPDEEEGRRCKKKKRELTARVLHDLGSLEPWLIAESPSNSLVFPPFSQSPITCLFKIPIIPLALLFEHFIFCSR